MEPEYRPLLYNHYSLEVGLPTAKTMSLSSCSLHRLLTTPPCEHRDCEKTAVWIVQFQKAVKFLCVEHTVECMSDTVLWRPRIRADLKNRDGQKSGA